MSLTPQKRKVIDDVESILEKNSVVTVSHIPADIFAASLQELSNNSSKHSFSFPYTSLHYISPEPTYGRFKVTRKLASSVDALVDHPIGTIREYPHSESRLGEPIAHRFAIDPSHSVNPRENMQYSIESQGGHSNVR